MNANWQPIETAPKERWSRILGWCVYPAGAEARIVTLSGFSPENGRPVWVYATISQDVTHWMPLPEPPTS